MNDTKDEIQGDGAMCYKPSLRERISNRLFRQRHVDTQYPDWFKDCVIVKNEINLSFPDRIRALISGRIRLVTKTAVDVQVNKCETVSSVYVAAPKFLEP